MKIIRVLFVFCLLPFALNAATERTDEARVGVNRVSMAAARAPSSAAPNVQPAASGVVTTFSADAAAVQPDNAQAEEVAPNQNDDGCRAEYRSCMDEFCLLDESEGYRCACSSNINQSKTLIQEIQKIQADAENLYTEGVEREQRGAKAKLIFGESAAAKKASRASGLSFSEWLQGGSNSKQLDSDGDIGDSLYDMAANFCAEKLDSCKKSAEMEETLYSRAIVQDCKNYSGYLAAQKKDAESNKKIAEAAVREARFRMLDTTNKYNRGECLLAYKSCISDKGGCGANFENCLDAGLLGRRANACEDVLDQCMAVKNYVLEDWAAESKMVLADAVVYADKNRRATCFAKSQACLEDSCSTASDSSCLTNVNIAAGICPVIEECNALVPGFKGAVNDKLGFLRVQFCQNDIYKCLQDKCGKNYTGPECVGKKTSEITALCPQSMFPSCNGESQFNIIVSSALLQMDYAMMQGCVNYFGTQLGNVCGTDMNCLPEDAVIMSLEAVPDTSEKLSELRELVRANARVAVEEFFKKFEKDSTVAACKDGNKPAGRSPLGASVFNTARLIGEIGAENRSLRQLDSKLAELLRTKKLDNAEQACKTTYAVETPAKDKKNYSYIKSVGFEAPTCNCHVCRLQQVCEEGGESKMTGALKAAGGGFSSGASMGTMVSPGWGSAIGGIIGAVGGGIMGAMSSGKKEFCQEIESCEDIAMRCD